MKNEFYFLSIVDKDIEKICQYSKIIEEMYDKDTLTGLNLAKTRDGNYLLGLTLKSELMQKTAKNIAERFKFNKITTKEENWIELMTIAEMCIIGNFTYKMITEQENPQTISVDMETYKRLKEAYEKAIKEGKEVFAFENGELLVSYAKYLLQYLEMKLNVH